MTTQNTKLFLIKLMSDLSNIFSKEISFLSPQTKNTRRGEISIAILFLLVLARLHRPI